MPATQHSEFVNSPTDVPVDEIELIDLLRVIWKWKYLIIGGTVVCALAAVIISIAMQPIYQVSMVLKPGVYKVGDDGNPVYLDSVEEFKNLIDGELIYKLGNHSKNTKRVVSPEAFKITANNKTNILRILYESPDREEGIEDLKLLSNILIERYEKGLKHLQDAHVYELMIAKGQLEALFDEEQFITSKLNDIQKRADIYAQEIDQLNDSSEYKARSQKTLLDYVSIVEKITELKRRQSDLNSQISLYKKEIADLEKEKIIKQAIIVAQPPAASQHPIKPKKKLIVILATMVGLFMTLFLSFFIEYISKNNVQKLSAD